MSILRFKEGVTLVPNAAGARLLGAIEHVARTWPTDITVTTGSDSHGPTDPHTLGQAFDIRTHGMTDDDKRTLVVAILTDLAGIPNYLPLQMTIEGIWLAMASPHWFVQIEDHNGPNEHAHAQLRNGQTFPYPQA